MKLLLIAVTLLALCGCSNADSSHDETVNENSSNVDETTDQTANPQQDEPQNEQGTENPEPDKHYVDLQLIADDADQLCLKQSTNVNSEALMAVDCPLLSQYGLFKDIQRPNVSFNTGITPYDLSVELFSDYARKYRAIYVPEGETIGFDYNSVFEFPLGTVLIKTFSMPSDTANVNFESEKLIETRLLIKREEGWRGLPYQWVNNGEDAVLAKYGALVDAELIHLEQVYQFKYEIPPTATCKTCHQITLDENSTKFAPIGPKARFLNWPKDYGNEVLNQLSKWQEIGYFGDFSPQLNEIDTVPNFELTLPVNNQMAKGYLDVNCAHCHQDGGQGGLSGLRLEYWREATGISHGVCKTPPGFDGGENNLHYDIVPGKADESILPYRMSHLSAKDMMPPLGRSTVHLEGVELIRNWINAMPVQDCGD